MVYQLARRFMVIREGLSAQLDTEETFTKSFIAHTLLVLADEGADEDVTTAGGKDAAVHIVAPLLVAEISPHMYSFQRSIQQPHLPDGREAPLRKANIALHGKELAVLSA